MKKTNNKMSKKEISAFISASLDDINWGGVWEKYNESEFMETGETKLTLELGERWMSASYQVDANFDKEDFKEWVDAVFELDNAMINYDWVLD